MTDATNSILDRPEARFPLAIRPSVPKIRALYRAATRRQWDPRVHVDWSAVNPSAYTPDQLRAARLRWSRQAWGEYAAISESPALQIRFCQERREPDLWLFFAIRTQEESRHSEAAFRMAEALGGYFEEPQGELADGHQAAADKDLRTTLYSHGVRRMAFDASYTTEAIIGSLVCFSEEVAFDLCKHQIQVSTNPVAKRILTLILTDEARHCAFGWDYLEHRVPRMSKQEIADLQKGIEAFVDTVEIQGYHHAWLKPDSAASRAEINANRLTAEAGLGASIEEWEKPILVDSIDRIRTRMKDFGFTLKSFHAPKLGRC